jgi:protein-tyrosine phosphatase
VQPVIDLHCHILPGIDDGASELAVSIAMARAAAAQGIETIACTPHITPGLYHNSGPAIREATLRLQEAIDAEAIPLRLVAGADIHICPDFVDGLRCGRLLSLADSRYVLVEPPVYTAPPQLEAFFFNLIVAGYVPILTHPERLAWVPSRYDAIKRLVQAGVWMQITAGSFTGAFGRAALYWAQRMLDEGCVHLIATDAHDVERRPPDLATACEAVTKRVGAAETQCLVLTRPMGVLKDQAPSSLPGPLEGMDAEARLRPAKPGPDDRAACAAGTVTVLMLVCSAFLGGCAGSSNSFGFTDSVGSSNSFAPTNSAGSSNKDAAAAAAEKLTAAATPGNSAYKIGPLDVLDISVFKVPDLSETVQVGDDGTISYPLVRHVSAAGRTTHELEQDLEQKLEAKYLRAPQVTVLVKEYNSQRITVEGSVKTPGVYSMKGKTSLVQAVAMSGGIDSSVGSGDVVVFRTIDGKRSAARFDYEAITKGNAEDPDLQPGDVVVADTSGAKVALHNVLSVLPLAATGAVFVPLL